MWKNEKAETTRHGSPNRKTNSRKYRISRLFQGVGKTVKSQFRKKFEQHLKKELTKKLKQDFKNEFHTLATLIALIECALPQRSTARQETARLIRFAMRAMTGLAQNPVPR